MTSPIAPSDHFQYYQDIIYWNNFDAVMHHTNFMISGNGSIDWIPYFKERYGTFERAFMLSCGNGWVERRLFTSGIAKSVSGTDISNALLDEARKAASEIQMPANYIAADVNSCDFRQFSADLVVNFAAMHHVAAINRTTQALADMLHNNGI